MTNQFNNIKIDSWNDLSPVYTDLKNQKFSNISDLEKWIKKRSDFGAVISEDLAWRYIKMSCNITDKEIAKHYEKFVSEIQPEISKVENELNKKLANSELFEKLNEKYFILKRSLKNEIKLFREENIPIKAELDKLEQKYAQITGSMTINYDNKELTMQQAGNYLKDTDRKIRETVYRLIAQKRIEAVDDLNKLMNELIEKRHQVALNAGFKNYRDYMHQARERFDYSVDDVLTFDEAIKEKVMPLINKIISHRKNSLNYDILKPWDLEVDTSGKKALKPFNNISEFIEKTINCFKNVRPKYGEYLTIMNEKGFLDLDSRKGKAPGGYNYPLMVSNIPFIFMNATSNIRDLETLVHEGGHAIHAFKAKDLELTEYKETPSEIAELASMSMELISMEHWDVFFENEDDLKRAKIHQLEGVISVLPWVATVDKFQHWIYTNPNHNTIERTIAWTNILSEYSSKIINYQSVEWYFMNLWQKQLHIFEVPFYYIEYAISQLGAIAIWRNYKQNPEKTLDDYEAALSLGYSKTLPELYKTAGIKFDFSKKYIGELMDFVLEELEKFY